jgi:adenylate cyclase
VAYLILHPGLHNERKVEVRFGENVIGRLPGSALFVDDRSLSRRHAAVHLNHDGAYVLDLGSKNGTFVGHRRIQRATLRGGEVIQCGDVVMQYVADDSAYLDPPTAVNDPRNDLSRAPIHTLLLDGGGGTGRISRSALNVAAADPGQRAVDKLRILLQVGQALAHSGPLDPLLRKVLDLGMQILDVDRAVVLMPDGNGVMQPRVSRTRAAVDPDEDAYSRNIVEYVRKRNVAAMFSDASHDPNLGGSASVVRHSIRSSLCAPLNGPLEGPLGILYFDNLSTPNRFTDEDLEFVTAFANQAAVALENARLSSRLATEAVARSSLQRFLPPRTAEQLIRQGARLEVVETTVTALFCDITGFMALSDRIPPREVVALLNEYFPRMSDIVFRHEGTLEKYIGDAVLAVFGAPFKHDDDADRALQAAIDMQREIAALSDRTGEFRDLRIHIGLDTGLVAAGTIGTEHYLQYAAIGPPTNLASRICGVAASGEILISEATRGALVRDPPCPIVAQPPVTIKGRTDPLRTYLVDWRGVRP